MNIAESHRLRAAIDSIGVDVMALIEYGSRAHGTADENSDHDLIGIFVEHDHQLYGLERAETLIYRIHPDGKLQRMGVSDAETRSGADVIELSLHPLRKFVSLAAGGNPSVLSTLWAPAVLQLTGGRASALLIGHRDAFLSKHAGFRHAGYARAQRDALLGRTNKRTNRPELVSAHGYDTKYAAHMIRLLLAGLDLVRDRAFHLPMKPEQVEIIREIRRGEIALDDLLTLSEKLETDLTTETEDSELPDSADIAAINDLLRQIRNTHLLR
ncbi:DNA polymerase beta superfamily protein [Leifsonia sp. NPDC058194]|uniref:DNA polymerase beta superfamily protein n=1 Tax=Leifsonia sp. NPDC058194 TaxID=3346374 RepID=UPI0036DCBCD3